MCGLFGQLNFEHAPLAPEERDAAVRLTRLAARRGPDGEGFWSDAHAALGFRRLAIFDPTASGDQPMRTPDGGAVLVYNGALYNYRELRRELEAAGVRFRSPGDAEVVLHALAHWGHAALTRFNGMFALAWYDARERRLLLARDHAGMKPLYLLRGARGFAFASQFDQIVRHPWSRGAALSPAALGLHLRLGYVPAPFALLERAEQVPAGSWLELRADGRERAGRFFDLPVFRPPDLAGAAADEAVEAAVRAAVRRHMLADVPVGVFLSGGVDSPLVAALAAEICGPGLVATTLGTGGDEHDESRQAAAHAREFGADHLVAHLTPAGALDLLDDVVAACKEPLADYSIFPTLFVSRAARARVKVALSGDGGDELFWGYTGRFGALLSRVDGAAPAAAAGGWSWQRVLEAGRGSADPLWPSTLGDLHRWSHSHGLEPWLRRAFPELPEWPPSLTAFAFDEREPERVAQWLRWNEFQVYLQMLLQKVDRGSMHASLEVRCPLLDREVIEVALRVDWRSCLDPARGIGKLPLRRALAKRVSSQSGVKRGFTVPMDEWLRGPLRPRFEEEVLERDSLAGLALDRAALRRRFERHLERKGNHGWELWLLLGLARWQSTHLRHLGDGAQEP